MIVDVLSTKEATDYMDAARIEAIAESVDRRIQHLMDITQSEQETTCITTENDVEENVAASYNQTINM